MPRVCKYSLKWIYQHQSKFLLAAFLAWMLLFWWIFESFFYTLSQELSPLEIQPLILQRVTWKYPKTKIITQKGKHDKQLITTSSSAILNDSYLEKVESLSDLEALKTTLVMMAYHHHEGLLELLQIYGSYSSLFCEIILIWNNPMVKFNTSMLRFLNISIRIIIYEQEQNSLANRWMIPKYHSFKTQSAMFIDDDIYASKDRIKCLLNVWNQHKNKIVSSGGYRSLQPVNQVNQVNHDQVNVSNHTYNKLYVNYEFDYKALNGTIFNYLLPGWGMTINIQNIFKLSAILLQFNLFDIIDGQIGHCDDIGMALSFSVIFGQGNPYFYGIDDFRLTTDESKRNLIQKPIDSHNYTHRQLVRSECLNLLLNQFKDYGVDYIPIYDHHISQHTINCYHEMSTRNKNSSLYCPISACYEDPLLKIKKKKSKKIKKKYKKLHPGNEK